MVFVIVWNYMPAIFVHEHREGRMFSWITTNFLGRMGLVDNLFRILQNMHDTEMVAA